MKLPISLIIRRCQLVVLLIVVFASFGGEWVGSSQTLPIAVSPRIYLPMIVQPRVYKGLAVADMYHFEDVYSLGASWWYNWTASPDDYAGKVPMLWSGRPQTALPQSYSGWVLVLNEPNVATQSNITPTEAVTRLNALREYYPNARLLCCGVSVWADSWMSEFWQLGGRPDGWHVHSYIESYITPDYIKSRLTAWHNLTGGDYWITEYGSPVGSLVDFANVTEWFATQNWITRIAAYTNRQPEGVSWAIGDGVEMVAEDGGLTAIGAYYAGR